MFRVFTLLADAVVYRLLGTHLGWIDPGSHLASSLHFFVEDVTKIFALVAVMIYVIGLIRAGLRVEAVRHYLSGKRRAFGYAAGSALGAVTPFCSCSSIPLFLGFTQARIPLGITMAFLITSPIVNEVALVLLGSLLGIRFMAVYLAIGLAAGVIGGVFLDAIGAERYLTPLVARVSEATPSRTDAADAGPAAAEGAAAGGAAAGPADTQAVGTAPLVRHRLSLADRHRFATAEVREIFGRIWKWILIGIGVGAALHGFVPEGFIAGALGGGAWWSVPGAVLVGIPLYSSASGMVPVAESLMAKGLPVGTTVAFMMSTVAASFPEFMLLKQVMKPRLLAIFGAILLVFFTLCGWILNISF